MGFSITFHFHRPLRWCARVALVAAPSCTLTGEDLEPDYAVIAPSLGGGAIAADGSPRGPASGGESEASEREVVVADVVAPEVDRSPESPDVSEVELTPSEPERRAEGASTACVPGSDEGCGDGESSGEGGPDCGAACPEADVCQAADDCESGVCASGTCQLPSCSDGVHNGDEEQVDCGGASCLPCEREACDLDGECEPEACPDGSCAPPTCADGLLNQDEIGVDCGGSSCRPCPCAYGAPEVLDNPNFPGNSLYSPSLSPDGLTLYFGLYVAGFPTEIVASSVRAGVGEPFGLGNVLPFPVNASVEGTPRLAAEEEALYFYSERPGGLGGRDIHRAQRSTPGSDFDSVTNVVEVNSTGLDHLPWVTESGLAMYLSSDRDGDLDLFRATRATVFDPWGAPEAVAELNSADLEGGMTLTSDERVILFASSRRGTSDLFRAVRAPGETEFGPPEHLASIGSDAEDTDPALSPDGTQLFFSSTRDGLDSRIWRVSRTCP